MFTLSLIVLTVLSFHYNIYLFPFRSVQAEVRSRSNSSGLVKKFYKFLRISKLTCNRVNDVQPKLEKTTGSVKVEVMIQLKRK